MATIVQVMGHFEFKQLVAKLCGNPDVPLPKSPGLKITRRHRLAPLAYRLGFSEFKADFIQNALFAELREQALVEVAALLAQEGIDTVALKGMAYVDSIYADPAERSMGDIDILLRNAHFPKALRILQGCGFALRPNKRVHLAPTHHAMTLDRGNLSLDVHRSLMQPLRANIDMEGVWSRVKAAPEHRPNVQRLAQIDEIVLHIAHIARHELLTTANSYVDLSRLLAALPNRLELWQRAAEFRLSRACRTVLLMFQQLRDGHSSKTHSHNHHTLFMPTPKQVLAADLYQLPRIQQIAAKAALVEGPKELIGLLAIGLYERSLLFCRPPK